MRLSTLLLLAAASAGAQEATEPAVDASSSPQVSSERLDRCATLGFDADALDCRLCDELSTFLTAKSRSTKSATSVDSVTGECQDCCSDFSKVLEAEGRRYPIAVLAVSRRRLKRYPKVANFVEHQAEHIKGLDVEESNPRLPMLQFFDANGDKMEEISVAHWDEDSIAEFIGHKLLPQQEMQEGEEVVEETVEEVVEMEVEPDKP